MFGINSATRNGNKTTITALGMFRSGQATIDINMPYDEFMTALNKYSNGTHIQDAFPTLDPHEREFILSGTTKEEWDNIFKEEE